MYEGAVRLTGVLRGASQNEVVIFSDLQKQGGRVKGVLSVHLIDGTYELFRQFYGRRRFEKDRPAPFGAVAGVLHSILEMIEKDATHIGVATDHVIESFRNGLWPGYKTGEGIERRWPRWACRSGP